MDDSRQLFAEYLRTRSEATFRILVERYVDLVYSAAIRLVDGDVDFAKDVTQIVFIDFARSAHRLSAGVMLGGWLHRHTCFVAAKALRAERRRRVRERKALEMSAQQDHSDATLDSIAPVLDQAINELAPDDRTAVLLRFFEQHDFRSIGVSLGTTEEAARKRVARALEKLHGLLTRRGVALSVSALGTALGTSAVSGAPVGFAAAISAASLGALATGAIGGSAASSILNLLVMSKLKAVTVTAVLAAGLATPLIVQHRTQIRLRKENESLRRQAARVSSLGAENERLNQMLAAAKNTPILRLPAPALLTTPTAEVSGEELRRTNLIAHLLKDGETPKLTAAQIESFLNEHGRSASSLLSAFRASGNEALLQEAMEKFPDDPQVAYAAVFKKDATAEERRRWIDQFKKVAPENSLADYLSAYEHLRDGHTDQAVQDLIAASSKREVLDYSMDFTQSDEEAYRSAGYSVAEAKTIASMSLLLPYLGKMKALTHDLVSLAQSYRAAGDEASAQAALQMGVSLGQKLDGSPGQALVTQLVGIAVQRIAFEQMDPASPHSEDGRTVKDRLDDLTQQRANIRELTTQFSSAQQRMSEQDWISYKDRWRAFGEEAALRWVLNKYPPRDQSVR